MTPRMHVRFNRFFGVRRGADAWMIGRAALEVAVGIAVLIVIGTSLILPFLPVGGGQ